MIPPACSTLRRDGWAAFSSAIVLLRNGSRFSTSHVKYSHGADWRSRPLAPLHRQADEGEGALAEQRFEIAQALDVGDVEVEAGLVNQQVDVAVRPRAHRIDAEMDDALPGQRLGGGEIHAGIVGRILLTRKGALVMSGAEQDR